MSSGVFISYRRTGGLETARNLYERLTLLNYEVFFDLTSMREGKFNQQIYEKIERADDFILILSEGALDRCVEEQDWLRMEIRHAISLGKNIIPIWKPTFKGFPPSLPKDIEDISLFDCVILDDHYYDAFFQKLIARLKSQRTGNVSNKTQFTVLSGHNSRFITFEEWLSKKKWFNVLRIIRYFLAFNLLSFGIGATIAGFIERGYGRGQDAVTCYILGIICLLVSCFCFWSAGFVSRLRKKYSSCISEVEQTKGAYKTIRNSASEIGLMKVRFNKIEILLPCMYRSIQKIDNYNFVLETQEGKSLYNNKKKEIIGHGPYDTIKKTKYKIECIGRNGIEMFSLDGYQRFD